MASFIIATALMIGVVGLGARWATAKNRRLQAEWSQSLPQGSGKEQHARHH
jgi:hypothetical protein